MTTNRRLFLKNILKSSVTMVIGKKFSWSHSYSNVWVNSKSNSAPQSFSDFTSKNEIEYADCIVIGAGMAGIVAARDLSFPTGSRQGMKVIVLESSHRIGGRILTLDDERMGGPVELGADYIHRGPSKEISIWNDIETYQPEIIKYPRMRKGLMYYDGWEDDLKSHLTMVLEWDFVDAISFIPKIDSYKEGLNISAKEWLDRQNYSTFGRNLVDYYLSGHLPGRLEQLSLKGFASDRISEQLLEWNEYGFKNGYGHFIKKMTYGLGVHSGRELDIRYNTPVKAIKYGIPGGGVEITTNDGQVFRAKTALITIPIGVLKSGSIEFSPRLPESKLQALSWIEVGDRAKFILKFKRKFWPDEAVFLTRIDSHREMARTYFIPHALDKNPEKNNILSIYFCGAEADKIATMEDRDIIRALCRDFDRMYPSEARKAGGSIYNNIETDSSGRPTYLKWQWSHDPHTKGSVSYLKAGEEKAGQIPLVYARRILADPTTTPGLFWAGEATAFGLHTQPSTTHGAHHTGKRAALEIKEYLLK